MQTDTFECAAHSFRYEGKFRVFGSQPGPAPRSDRFNVTI